MLLEGSNTSTVLTWVRPELDKHLDQIGTQLEHLASSKHIGDGIENVVEQLNSLKFTFEALVLQGATLVVEEMIAGCDALKSSEISDRQKTFGTLMDAVVVLPSYLDRLQAGHHDLPILLLPVINEIRTAYNANIVSEATLFSPRLDVPMPELERKAGENEPVSAESFKAFALRMRRQWEIGLVRWLQRHEDLELLSPLLSVCKALQLRAQRLDLRRLWWIAGEVIGGLLDGVTDNDVNLRRLFARLNLNLKTLTEGGEEAAEIQSVDAISQALLFHIAQAKSGSPSVDKLREQFHLEELVPDRDVLIRARGALTGRNRELYTTLGAAIRDELALVKDVLDLELRTGEVPANSRDQIHESLLRLQDALKMIGLGDSAQSIERIMPAFDAGDTPDYDQQARESLLMDLAGKLIQVESILEEQIATLGEPLERDHEPSYIELSRHEQQRIRTHLLDETVTSLHQLQNGVHRHLNGEESADYTSPLEHIAGALELIGEPLAASLTVKLRKALGNLLRTNRFDAELDRDKLESIADAVAALELYLAGCRDQQRNREKFLDVLIDRLDKLPVGEVEVVETSAAVDEPVTEDIEDTESAETALVDLLPSAIEPELLSVFLEEFETIIAALGEQLPLWMQRQHDISLMTDIRRGFHSLKGSGRMVGADEIGDFAWHIEEMLNAMLEGNIESIDDVSVMLGLSTAMLPSLKDRLLQEPSELTVMAIGATSQQATNVAEGGRAEWMPLGSVLPAYLVPLLPTDITVSTEPVSPSTAITEEPSEVIETSDVIEPSEVIAPSDAIEPVEPAEPAPIDPVLIALTDNLLVLKGLMARISVDRSSTATEEEILAVQTLAGVTMEKPLGREPEIATALQDFLESQYLSEKEFSDTAVWAVVSSLAYFETCLALHEGDTEAELAGNEDSHIEQLNALAVEFAKEPVPQEEVPEAVDAAVITPDEVAEEIDEVTEVTDEVAEEIEEVAEVTDEVAEEIEEVAEVTDEVAEEIEEVAEVTDEVAEEIEEVAEVTDEVAEEIEEVAEVTDEVAEEIEEVAEVTDEVAEEIDEVTEVTDEVAEEIEEVAEVTDEVAEEIDEVIEVTDEVAEEIDEVDEVTDQDDAGALTETVPEEVDLAILEIFLEEATDILGRCDSMLNTWRDNLPDLNIVQNLQREFHTFKGGSRMAGVSAMGNLSHAMETLLESIAGGLLPPTVSAIEALEQGCDNLNTWTEMASQGVMPQAGETLALFEQQVAALTGDTTVTQEPADIDAVPSVSVPEETEPADAAPVESKADDVAAIETKPSEPVPAEPEELQEIPDVVVPPGEAAASEEQREEATVSQHIRVNADLLDSLVNSAGEISIYRSHLEQQVGHMRENLKEFDDTVARLRGQFRNLEIETETQIRSRYQPEVPDGSNEFDPLEMDRFSSLQHLSRALTESVSDLLNLQELLETAARKSEALLTQQSRVSTDLQEGLMQTRMVHFGTIAPRLRRITRIAAKETRNKARLTLRMTGGGDRLDRNVLERITAPLEHLLRNSIVHGIEKPDVRRKLNKPEEGQLSITVSSEATEFVVRVADDGAGMDLKAIHKRAIAMGLVDDKSVPPPQQLLQFTLQSGFSTSKTVTALAGRGVGMDVVNSEIKQIGGSVEIDSEEGKGTCFTIRIPFSLAVMQVIGVLAGEHHYLIPLASVSGVARMLPADFQGLLENEKPVYEFADETYSILELESLLGEPPTPLGDETISVLMIKVGDQRAAFPIRELLGHKEIIVKPVGPQVNSVPGILGGTITGDGQVVIIIDAGPLIRQALMGGARPAPPMEIFDTRPDQPLALVVDDSITIRKVTTRVLESNEFDVVTARDGVDAVEFMQERIPDLLVLDIEMPRMDGYQVAEHIRADARLRHIPIVMITSRAGAKHHARGKQAGANAILSKPYKESELLSEVHKLLPRDVI